MDGNSDYSAHTPFTGLDSRIGSKHDFIYIFFLILLLRYARLLVGALTWNLRQPTPVPEHPKYGPRSCSVIVPTTFRQPGELMKCLASIVENEPRQLIIVTGNNNVDLLHTTLAVNGIGAGRNVKIVCLGVPKLNKRVQMLRGIEVIDQEKTPLLVFADDDVFWPPSYLDLLLACFEDDKIGAAGTKQRVVRQDEHSFVNYLGIAYLERRQFNNVLSHTLDGSLSTLSGRTSAFRASILCHPDFAKLFSGTDDKFLTSFCYSRGYQIGFQSDEDAVLYTTLEDELSGFCKQATRWVRGRWSGNVYAMRHYSYIYNFPAGLWCNYITMLIQPPALIMDSLLIYLLLKAFPNNGLALGVFLTFLMFSKVAKMLPHFRRYPSDIRYVPISILFSYFHGFIYYYAVLTMFSTSWGSQNTTQLEKARATAGEVVPLLKDTIDVTAGRHEPTSGQCSLSSPLENATAEQADI